MPDPWSAALTGAVALALAFNFVNGFHDPSNTVATSIATRALTLPAALMLGAVASFAGAFMSHKVAFTMASSVAAPDLVDAPLLAAACGAGIVWNLFTWRQGLPTSSTHSLVAALFGAAMAKGWLAGGAGAVAWSGLAQILLALMVSPALGFVAAYALYLFAARLLSGRGVATRTPNRMAARAQVFSAAAMSFANGANDAQKTMGLMALAMFHAGALPGYYVPLWVTAACALAVSLGMVAGGFRVIRTVAKKLTDLQPVQGLCAETASGAVTLLATFAGMPVSTTHVMVSSVVGVGAAKSYGRAPRVVILAILNAWLVTIPACAALGAALFFATFLS